MYTGAAMRDILMSVINNAFRWHYVMLVVVSFVNYTENPVDYCSNF